MKIAVAMSGGVDSSVAAYLLKKQGHEIIGVTMIPFDNNALGFEENEGSLAAVQDAKAVCEVLEIEHKVIDVTKEFEQIVIHNFLDEYQAGRTPNPCTLCNPTIKWGVFFEKSLALGYDKMATGHYVKIREDHNQYSIFQADDIHKDQTYMLWSLNQFQLSKTLFPIASYKKDKIRAIALEAGIPVAEKKDSQEICFIKNHYEDLLIKHFDIIPGDIYLQNKKIGTHRGYMLYTIGQRKGLNTPWHKPLYVKTISAKKNQVQVTDNPDDLLQTSFIIRNTNWIHGYKPNTENISVQIRYNSRPVPVKEIVFCGRDFIVKLQHPVRAISPGQSAVFYRENELIGGGIIYLY